MERIPVPAGGTLLRLRHGNARVDRRRGPGTPLAVMADFTLTARVATSLTNSALACCSRTAPLTHPASEKAGHEHGLQGSSHD